jgi:hypothetical protein
MMTAALYASLACRGDELLCLTYTMGPNHDDRIAAIAETWGRLCDGYAPSMDRASSLHL